MNFEGFGKIPRLNREVVITEKIDGTNAQVAIAVQEFVHTDDPTVTAVFGQDDCFLVLRAGSRKRWVTPTDDNFGFAAWVHENAEELVKLGPGRHFGEWWGKGIQRNYGLDERRFSLFNVSRWRKKMIHLGGADAVQVPECCDVVPVIGFGPTIDQIQIERCLGYLREHGSYAAKGFMKPEGIIVYHTAANYLYKVTLEKDDEPKGKAA